MLAIFAVFDDLQWTFQATDLIVIDWTKCEHLNHHSEHIVPGSGSDAGRMYVSVSNFDNVEWDGEILYALDRAVQDNGSPDTLNSWIVRVDCLEFAKPDIRVAPPAGRHEDQSEPDGPGRIQRKTAGIQEHKPRPRQSAITYMPGCWR